MAEGADVIDVGGESSRPRGVAYGEGAAPVTVEEELRRVLPVVFAIAKETRAKVSVDTIKAEVARQALEAGATIVNDVSCGRHPDLLRAVASAGADLVLMHNRGRGEVEVPNTRYSDVALDVRTELLDAVTRARLAGVAPERIWIDPGLGFAKTALQSVTLLGKLEVLVNTGHAVLVGPSRKLFIAEMAPLFGGEKPAVSERLGGTAASVTAAVLAGARAVRVHDVAAMRQAVLVAMTMRAAAGTG